MVVAKTVYFRPDLNRYISGRRYYQRYDITLGFVAKKRFEDHSEERLVVATAPEDWTLTAVTPSGGRQGASGTDREKRRCQRGHGYLKASAPVVFDAVFPDFKNFGLLRESAG